MKYIVFVDCDGTIIDDNDNISKRTIKSIENLIKNNCLVILCTGRPRYSVNWIKEKTSSSKYIVSSNGSEIFDCDKQEVIYQNIMKKEDCFDVFNKAFDCGSRVVLVSDNNEYVTSDPHNEFQIQMDNHKEIIETKNIKQIMILNDNYESINNLRAYVSKQKNIAVVNEKVVFNRKAKLKPNKSNWISVANRNTSKGNALKILSKLLKIPKKNIYAIGNDYNDVSMFKNAGTSICLENSPNEIKDMVDIVTSSNNDEGAAKVFEQILKDIKND